MPINKRTERSAAEKIFGIASAAAGAYWDVVCLSISEPCEARFVDRKRSLSGRGRAVVRWCGARPRRIV